MHDRLQGLLRRLAVFLVLSAIALNTAKGVASTADSSNTKIIGENQPPDTSISYQILEEDTLLKVKASLDVGLPEIVDEQTLNRIATELRSDGRSDFERLFICYYLPGMKPGEGAWATTHFNPKLEVKILGLTKAQQAASKSAPKSAGEVILGKWIDNVLGAVYVFVKGEDGKVQRKFRVKDGDWSIRSVTTKTVGSRVMYIESESSSGDYYEIQKDGSLGLYDSQGLVYTLPPID